MADQENVTTPTPSAAPVAAPAPTASTPPAGEEWRSMSTEAFNKRLEEQKAAGERSLLKAVGLGSLEDVKAKLVALKALEEAQLTAEEKTKKQLEELGPKAQRSEALLKTVAAFAEQQLGKLPEDVQVYVKSTAGDDPEAQLKQIVALEASGMLAKLTASAAPVPTTEPKKPATTSGPNGPASNTGNTPTAFEQYEQLRSKAPGMAAQLYQRNEKAIEASRPPK